ncbi:Alpha,alpha-trehalose-phosphate synthase [UDP-forming] 1 [Camellia lanceoleosa]|uniref:Alpha,alpha-trehalose-phosphate synthase [UDP-forming] 1 n=1 Tax=Camellia lanceoleosa TaxID=1840588 RepID=A0ACC0F2K3_9ERIC|nr:Alpha,alpha-trehalose-phosphate synthase [UDP-forming] 1 [Camellia lanceoleosa]
MLFLMTTFAVLPTISFNGCRHCFLSALPIFCALGGSCGVEMKYNKIKLNKYNWVWKEFEARWIGWAGVNVPDEPGQRALIKALSEKEGDIWCHDYHLMFLPKCLKEHNNDMKVGWFLHTPFPSSEIRRTLPSRSKLLHAILAADLVG